LQGTYQSRNEFFKSAGFDQTFGVTLGFSNKENRFVLFWGKGGFCVGFSPPWPKKNPRFSRKIYVTSQKIQPTVVMIGCVPTQARALNQIKPFEK